MKNVFTKCLCATALTFVSFASVARIPLAVWDGFEGLSADTPLQPSYSSTYNQIDGSIWRFNLGGGTVSGGELATGTGVAPNITFGDNLSLNFGYITNVVTVVMEIDVPVTSVEGAPFVHLGNGENGIGLASKDSTSVCGTWGNSAWNKDTVSKQLDVLNSEATKTIFLAVSPRSAGLSYAAVEGGEASPQWIVLNGGLKTDDITLSHINFGNYVGAATGGMNFKIKRAGVFWGDDLADAIGCMNGTVDVVLSDVEINSSSNELGKICILSGKTVTVKDGSKLTANTVVSGSGTIKYEGFVPAHKAGLTNRTYWKGCVGLCADFGNNHDFSQYGNADSVIHFMSGATANYLSENKTIASDFILDGVINHNNGWSSRGGQNFSGKVTGTGSFITSGSPTDVIKFTGDMAEFAGTITVNGGHCVAIGTQNDDDSQCGKIVITTTANIASDKTWSAENGLLVRSTGTIGGAGSVDSLLVFESGATVSGISGVLKVSGDLTLPDMLNVTLSDLPTGDQAVQILGKSFSLNEEEIVRDTEIVVNGSRNYYLVKKDEGFYVKAKTITERKEVVVGADVAKISDVMDAVKESVSNLIIVFPNDGMTFLIDASLYCDSITVTRTGSDELTKGSIALAPGATLSYSSLNLDGVALSADAAFFAANTGLISGNGKVALASGRLELNGANTYSGGTDIAKDAVLTARTDSLGTGPISGAGELRVNGYLDKEQVRNSLSNKEAWTGRFVCTANVSAQDSANWLGASGNENSQIEFTGTVTGFFQKNGVCAADLIVTGAITNNNGWPDNGGYTFSGKLLGNGIIHASNDGVTDVLKFMGETKDFMGAITVVGARCISFGDTRDNNDTTGQLIIRETHVATVAEGKVWSAVNGVVVHGTIGGAGSISSALTLKPGATLDVSSGDVLSVDGALAIEGWVNVIVPSNASLTGTPIIKYKYVADDPPVAIGNLKVDGYKLGTEIVDGFAIVKIVGRTGFSISIR